MGYDGVTGRYGLHEVPNDPVGVYRHARVGQLGPPFSQPGVPVCLNFPGRRLALLAGLADDVPAGVDHLPEHQLGVADYRVVDVVVLIDIAGVVCRLNHRLAWRDVHAHSVLGEATADAEHHVRAAHEVVHRPRHDPGAAAQGQGMGLREGAFAQQGGHHRGLQQAGQLQQLFAGVGVHHPLAGVDDRVAGLAQGQGRRRHVPRVALAGDPTARLVVERLLGHLFQGDVIRDFHHHRAGPALAQGGEGAAHNLRGPVWGVNLLDGLGHAREVGQGVEMGTNALPLPGMAGRYYQEGHRIGIGSGHAGVGVLRPRTVLHGDDPHSLAVIYTAETVGDTHADPFLAADDGPDAALGRRLKHGCRGEAAQILHPFPFQYLGNGIYGIHRLTPFSVNYFRGYRCLLGPGAGDSIVTGR